MSVNCKRKLKNSVKKDSVRGKVLVFFIMVVIGLVLLFSFNQKGINQIAHVIEELSSVNPKQVALTNFQRKVAGLSDLQRLEQIQNQKEPSEIFLQEARNLKQSSDTLKLLFRGEAQQLERITRIDSLLKNRNSLFVQYLEINYNYVRGGSLDRELSALSKDIDAQNVLIDSNVVTTTKSYKTTTIIPTVQEEVDKKKKRKLKKNQEIEVIPQPQVIVEEKVNVKIDTVAVAQRDSVLASIEKSLHKIERKQQKSKAFVKDQEMILFETNGLIISELMKAVRSVEQQEMELTRRNNVESKMLANQTLKTTQFILVIIGCIALAFAGLIIRDVMRINRYRRELEAAKNEAEYHSMAKQRFLANMSHEIRTPLQSIIGYTELLKNQQEDVGSVQAIGTASNHLLQVVNEILDYSRIISGKFSFESKEFSLQTVINETWSSLILHPKAASLNMQLVVPDTPVFVKGDAFRLKQVLLNLVGNAIKFTAEGTVTLTVDALKKNNAYVLKFSVADTGQGISEQDLTTIFHQFEQAKNTISHQGTGLGLSIVKELIEAQGGTISVASELGKGTSFEVTLRYLKGAESEEGIQPLSNIGVFTHAFDGKIWMVDDDQLILKLYTSMLQRNSITHQVFGSAKELLAAEIDDQVKLIFADVRMPEISGIEMTKQLRERGIELPIVAVTAQVLPDEQEQLLEDGYSAILTKPFTEQQLLATIQRFTQQAITPLGFDQLLHVFDDPADVANILNQFVSDCTTDLQQLSIAMLENNADEVVLLVHRFAGRIAQMGDVKEGNRWKKLEAELRVLPDFLNDVAVQDSIQQAANRLKAQLMALKKA